MEITKEKIKEQLQAFGFDSTDRAVNQFYLFINKTPESPEKTHRMLYQKWAERARRRDEFLNEYNGFNLFGSVSAGINLLMAEATTLVSDPDKDSSALALAVETLVKEISAYTGRGVSVGCCEIDLTPEQVGSSHEVTYQDILNLLESVLGGRQIKPDIKNAMSKKLWECFKGVPSAALDQEHVVAFAKARVDEMINLSYGNATTG